MNIKYPAQKLHVLTLFKASPEVLLKTLPSPADKSRDRLEPFRKRGYSPGLIPTQPLPHRGMETFLHDFLADFSTAE